MTCVSFRQAVPFTASLTADSDKEFALYCSSQLLLPQDSEGTLIKVTYKPTLYGKTHKAKIIVQVILVFFGLEFIRFLYDIYILGKVTITGKVC